MRKVLCCILIIISVCCVNVVRAYAQDDEMVRVPATGDTVTGYTGCSYLNMNCQKSDVKPVTIKAFYIDKHEVTKYNSQVAYVAIYYQAKVYCESQGKRLPTEQEWLAAAIQNCIQNYTCGDEYVSGALVTCRFIFLFITENHAVPDGLYPWIV